MELRFKLLFSAPAMPFPRHPLYCSDKPSVVQVNSSLGGQRGCCHTDLAAGPAMHPQAAYCPPEPQLPTRKWKQPLSSPMDTKPWLQESFHTQNCPGQRGPELDRAHIPRGPSSANTHWMLNSGGFAVEPGQWTVHPLDHGGGAGRKSPGIPLESWGGAGPGTLASS